MTNIPIPTDTAVSSRMGKGCSIGAGAMNSTRNLVRPTNMNRRPAYAKPRWSWRRKTARLLSRLCATFDKLADATIGERRADE